MQVKKALVDPAALRGPVQDYVFQHAPAGIERGDVSTWIDPPFVNGLHTHSGTTANKDARSDTEAALWRERPGTAGSGLGMFSGGGSWKMMTPSPKEDPSAPEPTVGGDSVFRSAAEGLGSEPWLLAATVNNPALVGVAEALIGAPVRPAPRVRGVYTIWPTSDHSERTPGGHIDGRPGQLSAMILADTVAPHSGGFHIWPGSPHRLMHFFETSQGNDVRAYHRLLRPQLLWLFLFRLLLLFPRPLRLAHLLILGARG